MLYKRFALPVIFLFLVAMQAVAADVVMSGPLPAGNWTDLLYLGADYNADYIQTNNANADNLAAFGGEANQRPLPGFAYSGIPGATTDPLVWTPMHDDDGNWQADADNWTRYWHIYIISPDDRQARIHQASDDIGKVWVNGELALNETSPADCSLKAGINSVTIMLHEVGGAAWITTRMTDTNDQAFTDLEYTLQPWASVVSNFTINDLTNNSSVSTNEALVKVEFTTAGDAPAGYAITEDGSEPTTWETTAPTNYMIQSGAGEVTLTAWVKDAEGNMTSKQASIYYNPSTSPVISNIEVFNQSETATMVSWTTDSPCQSRVGFRNDASIDVYYTDLETSIKTEHFAVLTGLEVDNTYAYKLINNEVEDVERTFLQTADAPPEIPKSRMTADASVEALGSTAAAVIDDTGISWTPNASPAWIRLDLGARYQVRKLTIQGEKPDHGFNNIEVFVTDTDSTNKADWGEPAVKTQLPQSAATTDVNLLGNGRYVIVWGDSLAIRIYVVEMWVYGENIDPIITDFSVSDPATGNTSFTSSQMINVSASVTPGWYDITEYGITEDATALVPWLPQMPEIYGLSGEGEKELFLWVRDSNGTIVSKSTTITYSTTVPVVLESDVAGQTEDSAIVMWETDVPASGRVLYRAFDEVNPQEWIATDFDAQIGTRHFAVLTGLTVGATYEYKIENNAHEESVATYVHEGETPDIPKRGMTATASSTSGANSPDLVLDGMLGDSFCWRSNTWANPAWLCIDLGAEYRVTRVGYQGLKDNHTFRNYQIFVTNSDVRQDPNLGAPGSWGDPVATGQFPAVISRQDVDVYGTGRYVIIIGDGHQYGVYTNEVWIKGTNIDPIISDFTVFDQDTGSSSFTNLPLVDVSATVVPGAADITGYAITTEDVEPATWEPALPEWTTLPVTVGNVDLWLWVQDANGNMAKRQTSILFDSRVPAVSDVKILGQKETTAIASWKTDIAAIGRIGYREQGAADFTYTELEAVPATSHLHVLTGLTAGTTYEVVLENSKIQSTTVYTYLHEGAAPEIDKSIMTVSVEPGLPWSPIEGRPKEAVIDGIEDEAHSWQASAVSLINKTYLRIDMGVPYQVQMLGIVGMKYSHMFKDYEIYMTNSDSTDPADWGEPLAEGQFPEDASYQEVNLLGNARYFIIYGNSWTRLAVKELWLYGQRVDPAITDFAATDADTGLTDVTDSETVGISLTAMPLEGKPIVGYMVTESDVAPDAGDSNWQLMAPEQYTFTPGETEDVTLYAWIKDSEGNIASAAASISYLPGTVLTDVAATEVDATTVDITWATNQDANGVVKYKPMNGDTWTIVQESAAGTAHNVRLSDIVEGENYMIVAISNGTAAPVIVYPEVQQTWPIAGDSNLDCKVNIIDLIFVRNRLNKDVTTGDVWQADVNGDGKVNIIDLIYVRNRLNNKCP